MPGCTAPDPAPAIPVNREQSERLHPPSPCLINPRSADPQVCRVGTHAGTSSLAANHLQPPHAQFPQLTPAPAAEIGKPSFNRERRERVPPPNPATGPKTQDGKSISSRNALTHGLRAKKIENAVPAAMRAEYEKLRKQYLDDYRPAGAIESTLVDMVIFAAWQLYKVREMELFADIDLGVMGSFGRSEKLARYRSSHERLLFRSLNQLRQIQQERLLRETDQKAALPANIPPAVRLKPLFNHLKSLQRRPKTQSAGAIHPAESMNARAGLQKPSNANRKAPYGPVGPPKVS